MSNSKENKWSIFHILAWGLVIGGLIVVSCILIQLKEGYSLSGKIDLSASGQFGDYVGGVVGAMWALAGVIFFYEALVVQRNELSLYRNELRNQRQEFSASRVINIIYQQARIRDSKLENLAFQGKWVGAESLSRLKYMRDTFLKNASANHVIQDAVIDFSRSTELKILNDHILKSYALFSSLINQTELTNNGQHEPLFDTTTSNQLKMLVFSTFDPQEIEEQLNVFEEFINAFYNQTFSGGHRLYNQVSLKDKERENELSRVHDFRVQFLEFSGGLTPRQT